MADFNRLLIDLQNKSDKLKGDLMGLLGEYDSLFREANAIYIKQRMDSGNEGLEDFNRLLYIIRRNRDVVGSLMQGAKNIRPTGQFKFIEDDMESKKSPAQPRRQRKNLNVESSPSELADIEAPDEKELEVLNG
jgi:hypothetical protein